MDSNNLYYSLLQQAQKEKLEISKETLLKTQKLYQSSLKDLIKKLDGKDTYNQQFIKAQIKNLKYEFEGMNRRLEEIAVDGINRTSSIALNTDLEFYRYLDLEYNLGIDKDTLESLLGTNKTVIDKIISGGLYKDNKSLSERIWNYSEKNINDVQDILLKGIIQKQPIKEVCDSLKAYTGGGDSKVNAINRAYGKMNANALRLVRTSLNHSFVETMKDTNRKNPFVDGYKWTLSNAHSERMRGKRDECDDFAAHEEGLGTGVFSKNSLPGNHCNCLCIVTPYFSKSLEDIGTEINDWIKGGENKGIDEWAESRGYEIPKKKDGSSWHNNEYSGKNYKDKKEIIKHFADEYNIKLGDSGKLPIDKDLLNDMVNWLDKFHSHFKGFKDVNIIELPCIRIKANAPGGCVGYYKYYPNSPKAKELVLNAEFFNSKEYNTKYIKKCVESKWTVANAQGHKTFVHEYGHHIAQSMEWIGNEKFTGKWCDNFINDTLKEYNKRYNKTAEFKDIPELVGRYAGTNRGETFAEAFAEYFGGDNPRGFAKVFGERLEEEINKVIVGGKK